MTSKNKLKIQEFSRLCGVTVRTLRHYEQIGLLIPKEKDVWTGYRYYHISQMQDMENIKKLKELGYTLEEILDFFASGNLNPGIESLERKIALCEQELASLQQRHTTLLNILNSTNSIINMEKISIQSLPEIIVASHRTIIPSYNALGTLCVEVIGPEQFQPFGGVLAVIIDRYKPFDRRTYDILDSEYESGQPACWYQFYFIANGHDADRYKPLIHVGHGRTPVRGSRLLEAFFVDVFPLEELDRTGTDGEHRPGTEIIRLTVHPQPFKFGRKHFTILRTPPT